MTKRFLFLLIAMLGMTLHAKAQNSVFKELVPSDGSYGLFTDFHFAPLHTDLERMALRGKVQMVIEEGKRCGTKYEETYTFDEHGKLKSIVKPLYEMGTDKEVGVTDMAIFEYNEAGLLKKITEKSHDQIYDRWEEKKDITTLVYDGKLPQKEFFNGKETWSYFYKDNHLASVHQTTEYNSYNFTYTPQGWLIGNALDKGPFYRKRLTYDANGRCIGYSMKYEEHGPDGDYCEESNVKFTYNDKGDIIKATANNYPLNKYGKRIGKPTIFITTVSYKYDASGNWTEAIVKRGVGKEAINIFEAKRIIIYQK